MNGLLTKEEVADFNLRILWVDDDRFMITAFKCMLGALGCVHTEAVTGKNAGHQAIELIRNQHFDVVITDRKMPDVDGFSVAEVVRQVDQVLGKKRTPVLMVTISDVMKQFSEGTVNWRHERDWSQPVRTRAKELSVSLLHKPMTKNRLNGVLHMVAKLRLDRITICRSIPVEPTVRPNMNGSFIIDTLNRVGCEIVVANPSKRNRALHTLMAASKKSNNRSTPFASCETENRAVVLRSRAQADARARQQAQAHRADVQKALKAMGLEQVDLSMAADAHIDRLRLELAEVSKRAQEMKAAMQQQDPNLHAQLQLMQAALNSQIQKFCALACSITIRQNNEELIDDTMEEVLAEHRAITNGSGRERSPQG